MLSCMLKLLALLIFAGLALHKMHSYANGAHFTSASSGTFSEDDRVGVLTKSTKEKFSLRKETSTQPQSVPEMICRCKCTQCRRGDLVTGLRSCGLIEAGGTSSLNRVALVMLNFGGSWPANVLWWLETAVRNNDDIDFLVFHDAPQSHAVERLKLPGGRGRGIEFRRLTLQELTQRAEALGVPAPPRGEIGSSAWAAACSYRPFFGALFRSELARYAYWGWSDFDMILGDLGQQYSFKQLQQWPAAGLRGPLTFMRNTPEINALGWEAAKQKGDTRELDEFMFHTFAKHNLTVVAPYYQRKKGQLREGEIGCSYSAGTILCALKDTAGDTQWHFQTLPYLHLRHYWAGSTNRSSIIAAMVDMKLPFVSGTCDIDVGLGCSSCFPQKFDFAPL